jgi:hypothetical protein
MRARGIKPRGHDDDIGFESAQGRGNQEFKCIHIGLMPAARPKRDVQIEAQAFADATISGGPGFNWKAGLLVQRYGQRIVAVIICGFGAIAVVDVPIKHCGTQGPVFGAGGFKGDRDICQQAEPHRSIGQAVVSWRAGQHIGIVDLA